MEFEIQLALPHRKARVVFDFLLQSRQHIARKVHLESGRSRDALAQSAADFKILLGRAAATVSVAEGNERFVVQLLLLVALPGACHLRGRDVRHIGGADFIRLSALGVLRGQKIGVDPGAVNALPQKGVAGHFVGVVPADFGGHEPIHAAFTENLRERGRVPEHIGKPEHMALHAEFVPEEALAVKHLPHKRLAACQVAVGFHPHRALDFPFAVPDRFLYLFVNLRRFLLEVLIQEGLRGHETVFGVTLHQHEAVGKGALHLLPRLLERPEPRAVNVRMSDTDGHRGILIGCMAEFAVKFPVHPFGRNLDRCMERLGRNLAEVKQQHGAVEVGENRLVLAAVGIKVGQRIKRDSDVIPQLFHVPVQSEQLRAEAGGQGLDARVGVDGDLMPPCRAEIQAGMVDVHALLHHPVHPDQQLRVVGIPRPHPVGCDREEDILKILRHIDREAEPCMRIVAVAPCVLFRVKRGQRGIVWQFSRLFIAAGRPSDVRELSERHRTVGIQNFRIFFQFPYKFLHFFSPILHSFSYFPPPIRIPFCYTGGCRFTSAANSRNTLISRGMYGSPLKR